MTTLLSHTPDALLPDLAYDTAHRIAPGLLRVEVPLVATVDLRVAATTVEIVRVTLADGWRSSWTGPQGSASARRPWRHQPSRTAADRVYLTRLDRGPIRWLLEAKRDGDQVALRLSRFTPGVVPGRITCPGGSLQVDGTSARLEPGGITSTEGWDGAAHNRWLLTRGGELVHATFTRGDVTWIVRTMIEEEDAAPSTAQIREWTVAWPV